MAYIPPHKRHHVVKPSPSPASIIPEEHLNQRARHSGSTSGHRRNDRHVLPGGKIIYAKASISRWWAVGLTDDDQFPPSLELRPCSCESIEKIRGEKPLILVLANPLREVEKSQTGVLENPWTYIAQKIKPDLCTSLQNARSEIQCSKFEKVKPSLVTRFGKIMFHGGASVSLDTIRMSHTDEIRSKKVDKSFYTNVPDVYMKVIESAVVPKIGIDFYGEQEYYHVKIYDKSDPDATISCKCIKRNDTVLEIQKIELNPLRHLVADISCFDKNLDLRLMLVTKRILTALTEEEQQIIGELVKSAIIDPGVKGGLRWPFGRASMGDRFGIVGVWHTKFKAFRSPKMRLKLRHADRFDFRSSTGEVSREIILKMTEITKNFEDEEDPPIMEALEENLKLVWNEFLSFDNGDT